MVLKLCLFVKNNGDVMILDIPISSYFLSF